MQPRHKNTILFVLAWLGILMLFVSGIYLLPAVWQESSRLIELSARLNDSKNLETRMNSFLDNIKAQTASISAEIAERQRAIDRATFTRLEAHNISKFIDDLPGLFTEAGVNVINLGYQARETIEQFINLPFEAHIQCDYAGMRRMLHSLETHAAGIQITQIEFVNLDDDQHRTRLRLQCRVRFKSGVQ
ncbi:MAG: hypothetical protein ACD_39C01558G0003 [uncultured bacterium]|nr:MAG: hypothetical protein ACD_39C01558G0003 [uncultured bacterium]